jgi:hypothetical protein
MEDYLSDELTPQPALSASGIRTLIEATPLAFAARNERLWRELGIWPGDFKRRETKQTKRGTAVHSLLLGAGQTICVIKPEDYLTKQGKPGKNLGTDGAKTAIAEAEESGLLVLSATENVTAVNAATFAKKKILGNPKHGAAWERAEAEVTLIWQRQTSFGPIWCRCRPDKLDIATGTAYDPKTTERSLTPHSLASKFASEGTDCQAVWVMDGIESVFPALRGRSSFIPIAIEVDPPYDSEFLRFPMSTLQLIGQQLDSVCELFAKCIYSGEWPGKDNSKGETILPEVTWRERAIMEALEAEES